MLPAIDLNPMFQKHSKLMSAMKKSVPNSRFGSMRDNYCYNRCRPTIIAAKAAILEDGKKLIAANQWKSCLHYLVKSIQNAEQFMIWDDARNNKERDDLNKELEKMYMAVEKTLGFEVDNETQEKLARLTAYFQKIK